jgi:hypothetical protein
MAKNLSAHCLAVRNRTQGRGSPRFAFIGAIARAIVGTRRDLQLISHTATEPRLEQKPAPTLHRDILTCGTNVPKVFDSLLLFAFVSGQFLFSLIRLWGGIQGDRIFERAECTR